MSIRHLLHRTLKSMTRSPQTKRAGSRRTARPRPFRVEPLEQRRLLAVFAVDSALDTVDANVGDGLAEDAAGNTTLRAAIMEANASADADTINLPAGTYSLSLTGFGENGTATGDLDITEDLTIAGADAATTTIDAASLVDRIFDLRDDATVAISGLTLTGGQANNSGTYAGYEDNGGAIRADFLTNWTLTDCVLTGNSAPNGSFGQGGAVANLARTLTIDSCQFTGNSSSNSGGALYTAGTASGNLGTVTITDSSFSGNSSTRGGAILSHSAVTIQASTLSGNIATGQGGAIDNSGGGNLTLVNTTLSGNQGSIGGAVINYETLDILNCTIAHNSASGNGGGIRSNGSGLSLENTIIANNTTDGGSPNVYGAVNSQGHNLIGDAVGSTGFGATGDLLSVDPLLAPLADNGGPVWTHEILNGSPAIDAGSSTNAPALDPRGTTRPFGSAADIGAFERTDADDPPLALTVDAGGPYVVAPGGTVTLAATADPIANAASFDWNFDTDGEFDDATGATPVFSAAGIAAGTSVDISLQVTDNDGGLHTDTATVQVYGSLVQLAGTEGDDVIEIHAGTVAAGTDHVVTINGTTQTFAPDLVTQIQIDGLAGADLIVIHGTDQNETATLQPGSVDMTGGTYQVQVANVEDVTVYAGSGDNDQASLTGSSDSNRLHADGNYSRLSDSIASFSHRVEEFDTVTVEVAGVEQRDYAYLYDSPGADVLDASPETTTLDRADGSADVTANGFTRVYVYATAGDGDTATLTGSDTTRNRFYSYADYSILTESVRSFYFYARGFDTLAGNSPGAEYTYAYLHDSVGADLLTAAPTSATMNRVAPWADTTANGFKRLYAYSTRGGSDIAELTGSSAGNYYRGYPTYSTLNDATSSFYHYVRGFRSVETTGSETDTSGDRAYLYDSTENDTFFGRANYGYMEDTAQATYHNKVWYFDTLYARSSDDETLTDDTIDVDESLVYNLIQSGTW